MIAPSDKQMNGVHLHLDLPLRPHFVLSIANACVLLVRR